MKKYMFRFCKSLCMMMLLAMGVVSCVEEYNEKLEGGSESILVVEGSIVSGTDCTFNLGRTAAIDESPIFARKGVAGAIIVVKGSDGATFVGKEYGGGKYVVSVGTLSADEEYWVEIETPEFGYYESTPMKPIYAPELVKLEYEQPHPNGEVYFLVSTGEMQGRQYLLWQYEECYEVVTPIVIFYVYDPVEDRIVYNPNTLGHGWKEISSFANIVSTNADFNDGAISRYSIYSLSNQNIRFRTRYRTFVKQVAISEAEYEYLSLLNTQSSEMGGLFTPMPTELPSNLHGKNKAVGYVGVRGNMYTAELYVNRYAVGYAVREVYTVAETAGNFANMYRSGYRLAEYDAMLGDSSAKWALRWVVDCTDSYWGASLTKPAYWRFED